MAYTIIQVERKTGIAYSKIKFWLKKGLFPLVYKDKNGVRYFNEDDLEWVYWVNFFRYTQMSIQDIKQYYEFYLAGDSKLKERRAIIIKHQKKIAKDIKEFQKIYQKLENKLKTCERDPELDFKEKST